MKRAFLSSPAALVGLYVAFGVGWILVTDLLALGRSPSFQTSKGLVFVAVSGTLLYVLLTISRGREEEAVSSKRIAERRFRAVIENSPEMISILDADGRVLYRSPGYANALGWSEEEIRRTPAFGWVHPDDAARVRHAFLVAPPPPYMAGPPIEFRLRAADETWRIVEGTPTNLLVDPAVGGIVVHLRDRTEQRRTEVQLRHAQRMETIGQLAGGISHDFNNLLTAIRGYNELVLATLEPGDPRRDSLLEVERAANRATRLVEQLLTFARKRRIDPEVVDLNSVLDDMEGMLRRLMPADIRLEIEAEPDLPPVWVDPGQVEQVVLNLTVNARDAMPDGGHLRISTRTRVLHEPLTREEFVVPPGRWVAVRVTDSGTGMDAETRRRIFEPFFSTKSRDQGTGLGLATVYGIVKQSRGFVVVESEPGAGATFEVLLPPRA